jgi:hypothetical protein
MGELLHIQQNILSQILLCKQILQFEPKSGSVEACLVRLEKLLDALNLNEFGDLEGLGFPALLSGKIDFDLPTDADQQLLVGMVFAESSSGASADDDEKQCMAECIVNMAYFATYTVNGKHCYNTSFGDGTVLNAIEKGSAAHGGPQWSRVMSNNAFRSKADLEKSLNASEIAKLKACVVTVAKAVAMGAAPITDTASNRVLIQFNQANDSPPSGRQEKAARHGSHSFYAFKAGRECQ